jgi:hypothetical protein
MTSYSLRSCEVLIDKYINEYGGQLLQIEEGILGLGFLLLYDAKGKKTVVIREFFVNAWTSGHSVRKYNTIPNKYSKLINT